MKKLLLQAIRFMGFSGIGWILDFSVYMGVGFVSSNLVLNNIISSWVGVTFVFVCATRKVFENNSKISIYWKYLIYMLYQCVLIYMISKLLNVINTEIVGNITIEFVLRFSSAIAKILVTPITMSINFFVMKGIIEKL